MGMHLSDERKTDPPSLCPTPYLCEPLEGLILDTGIVRAAVERIEDQQAKLAVRQESAVKAAGKRSSAQLAAIAAIAVAAIGGLTQWQVTRMTAEAQVKAAEATRQNIVNNQPNLERLIEETSKRTARATLDERDRQVDRLAARARP
jgi:hypothetical protein